MADTIRLEKIIAAEYLNTAELKSIKALMHNFKINEFAKTLREKMPNGE